MSKPPEKAPIPSGAEAASRSAREAFRRYCESPPPDSALARAIAFGVDPTLTFRNMFGMTPEERLDQAGQMINTANDLVRLRAQRR